VGLTVVTENVTTKRPGASTYISPAFLLVDTADGRRVVKESSDSGVELEQAAESVATADGTALGT